MIFPFFSLERSSFIFCPRKNNIFSVKKITLFLIIQERPYSSAIFFGKTIFLGHLKKISYFYVFFWEISYFIFRLKNKMIFLGERNIIFWDKKTRKIIFQCNFLWKDYLFRTFRKQKVFSCSDWVLVVFAHSFIWWHMYLHLCHSKNSLFEFYETIVSRLKFLFYIKISKSL